MGSKHEETRRKHEAGGSGQETYSDKQHLVNYLKSKYYRDHFRLVLQLRPRPHVYVFV